MTTTIGPAPFPKPVRVAEKTLDLCVCEAIDPVNSQIAVVILRHPQDQDKTLGAAMIAQLSRSRTRC